MRPAQKAGQARVLISHLQSTAISSNSSHDGDGDGDTGNNSNSCLDLSSSSRPARGRGRSRGRGGGSRRGPVGQAEEKGHGSDLTPDLAAGVCLCVNIEVAVASGHDCGLLGGDVGGLLKTRNRVSDLIISGGHESHRTNPVDGTAGHGARERNKDTCVRARVGGSVNVAGGNAWYIGFDEEIELVRNGVENGESVALAGCRDRRNFIRAGQDRGIGICERGRSGVDAVLG